MVSNSLKVSEAELIAALERIRADHAGQPDYLELRATLPADWPM